VRTEPLDSAGGGMERARRLTMADKRRLRTALLRIDAVAEPATRAGILRELRAELGDILDPSRFDTAAGDAWQLLSRCIELGAIRPFVDAVALVVGESAQWRAFADLVDDLVPEWQLASTDRDVLVSILEDVPAAVIAEAVTASGLDPLVEERGAPGVPVDGGSVLAWIESMIATGNLPPERTWQFLEAVAHRAEPTVDLRIHRAIAGAATYLGVYEMASRVCATTVNDLSGTATVDPDTYGAQTDGNVPTPTNQDSGVDDMSVATAIQPLMTAPAVMRGLPPRNAFFAGRAEILSAIRNTLEGSSEAAVLPHALHGLGGVGKTQVALEYSYRYSPSYDLIFWIVADDEQAIRRSIISLGKALGVPESTDVQYMIDNTLDELRAGHQYPRWLLVFDNATDPKIVRNYLPGGRGHILITSRNAEWRAVSTFIEVDVFSDEECRTFLERRWPSLTAEQASMLSIRLGRLPLALNQAAAFHAETGMPLAEYLDNYDELVSTVTQTTPSDYPQPVAATWRLAFDRLNETAPAAAQLLQLCCFLSSEPIAVPMLRAGRGADVGGELKRALQNELSFRRAVQELGKYALAQIDTTRDLITVHSLVRAVLRDALDVEERQAAQHMAHDVLAFANPGDPDQGESWARHRQIAPHVIPSGLVHSDDPHVRQVLIDQIRYAFSVGDFVTSRRLAEHALENWRSRLGPDDVMTLRARFHLGNALRMLGEHEQARRETQETYDRLERTLGPEHEYTLAVANSLGADLRFLGEFGQAHARDAETLERHRTATDDEAIGTLRAANNLAVDLRLLGDFEAARALDADTVQRRAGADVTNSNPATLLSINNLVRDLVGLGRYREALALQSDRLSVFESRLGQHRTLMVARRNLAIIHRRLGDPAAALGLAEAVEQAERQTRGPRHDSTLAAATTLFNTMRTCGDLAAARELGEETLAAYEEAFFREHPFTLACGVNLAIVYRALGMHDEARRLDEASLAGFRRRLGDDHPHTLVSAANHTNNLARDGESARALEMSRDIHERSLRVRPAGHPNTLAAAANLALDLDTAGDHAAATALRRETIEELRRLLGPEHPETINVERGRRAEIDLEVPPL
jgi:tetratricopeptide (TPR) repeat protein